MSTAATLFLLGSLLGSGPPVLPVTGPYWVSLPLESQKGFYHPRLAGYLRVEGSAKLRCVVTSSARLERCVVIEETPNGWAFGRQAQRLAEESSVAPSKLKEVGAGNSVELSLAFSADDYVNPYEKDFWNQPETKAQLGERAIAALGAVDEETYYEALLMSLMGGKSETSSETFAALSETVSAAAERELPAYRRREAEGFASHFSEDELRDIVAFLESPSGSALVRQQRGLKIASGFNLARAQDAVAREARAKHCAKLGCPPSPLPVAAPRVGAIITNPDWIATPSWEDFDAVYPSVAVTSKRSARVTMRCVTTAEGGLSNCTIISEDPPHAGFGVATLSLARHFRMRPKTADGTPVERAQVRIPVAWVPPGPSRPPQPIVKP